MGSESPILLLDRQTDKYIKINQWFAIKQCHSIAIQRRHVLRPEGSLPHRPLTTIIIFIYKLTGLSIYSMTFKHNYNKTRHYITLKWDTRCSPAYKLQIHALEKWEDGIEIGGKLYNNLRYADDVALLATTAGKLQELVNDVGKASERFGLSLVIGRHTSSINIMYNGGLLGTS